MRSDLAAWISLLLLKKFLTRFFLIGYYEFSLVASIAVCTYNSINLGFGYSES